MSESSKAHSVRLEKSPSNRSAKARKPSAAQLKYLRRGLQQPGGKLPLFDGSGREFSRKTVEACIGNGWAEPWFSNPIKPDWLVCKLTGEGYRVLGTTAPDGD